MYLSTPIFYLLVVILSPVIISAPGFSIGGNIETALFDTGSLFNVVEQATADKIEIE